MPVVSLLATATPPPFQEGQRVDPKAPTYVVILFALVRLEKQATDMEITLNIPNIPDHQDLAKEGEAIDFASGKYGEAVSEGMMVFEKVLKSLEVKDWGLFGPPT